MPILPFFPRVSEDLIAGSYRPLPGKQCRQVPAPRLICRACEERIANWVRQASSEHLCNLENRGVLPRSKPLAVSEQLAASAQFPTPTRIAHATLLMGVPVRPRCEPPALVLERWLS